MQLTKSDSGAKKFIICGSALRGQPNYQNLRTETFVKEAVSRLIYRLHSLKNGWHPGISQVESGGNAIHREVYELTPQQYALLMARKLPIFTRGSYY